MFNSVKDLKICLNILIQVMLVLGGEIIQLCSRLGIPVNLASMNLINGKICVKMRNDVIKALELFH